MSDEHVLEECADATFPIPASQYNNVFGPEKSSVFVHRQPKGYRAPPQTTMEYVAKNKSSGGGTGRILGQNLIEDNMRNLMRNPGTFDSLKPPPLLTGSLTQNFRVKNISKMTKPVDRPKQQAVETDRSQLPGNVSTQPHVVSRILALSNAQVPPPTGFSSDSTTVLPLRNSVTSNITSSGSGRSVSDRSSRSGTSVSDVSNSMASSYSDDTSTGPSTGAQRSPTFSTPDDMERGFAGPSSSNIQDPALLGSFGPAQQRLLTETIREVNNPVLRQTSVNSFYQQRQLRSGTTQETDMGSPSLSLERPQVQARGQAGPSSSQPPKAAPPPDA